MQYLGKLATSVQSLANAAILQHPVCSMQYLGKLNKMVLQHDNSGPSPEWHLFKAVVTCSKDDSETTFMCNKWIESKVCFALTCLRVFGVCGARMYCNSMS